MSTVIMSCAGRSSRFENTRPKPFLTSPNGDLMMMSAITGLGNISRLIIMVIKEHIEKYAVNLDKIALDIQTQKGTKPEFYILDDFMPSRTEAVNKLLIDLDITGSIFIKDCDNDFDTTISDKNAVCISHLTANINAINKAYVVLNKYGHISSIVEKSVINDLFCVGGYSFADTAVFRSTFDKMFADKNFHNQEIYLSHMIQDMILNGEVFDTQEISNYKDWGTLEEWQKYCSEYKTIFLDIDGCLVLSGGEYIGAEWGTTERLTKNISLINKLHDSGKTQIILTTSRKEKYRDKTVKQLEKVGLRYHGIMFGLLHAQRVLVNDYSTSNPYPSAVAINLKRDADELELLLRSR